MKANSILETIGNTPHVRINRLFSSDVEVWSKLERANPGGSIKDRIALSMIEDAEAKGILKVAFDRGYYRYHGRIKALADAAREGGLQF